MIKKIDKSVLISLAVVVVVSLVALVSFLFSLPTKLNPKSDALAQAGGGVSIPVKGHYNDDERCDSFGRIIGSDCPCPPNKGYSAICGYVRNAKVSQDLFADKDVRSNTYAVRTPISGVTIGIYEYDENYPTGKRMGEMGRQIGHCITSDKEGKYSCLMQRVVPGTMVHLVYKCNGENALILAVPSHTDFTNLDVDLACGGGYGYVAPDTVLDMGALATTLTCQSTFDYEANQTVGYEINKETKFSANIGEVNGDTRYTPRLAMPLNINFNLFGGALGSIGNIDLNVGQFTRVEGSYAEKECLTRYDNDGDLGRYGGVSLAGVPEPDFATVEEKCNFDPDVDFFGELEANNREDFLTTPTFYDLPDTVVAGGTQNRGIDDNVFEFEGKETYTTPVIEHDSMAQANAILFSDCSWETYAQPHLTTDELAYVEPIPCEELLRCNMSSNANLMYAGDEIPAKEIIQNTHTTSSYIARMTPKIYPQGIYEVAERDRDTIACKTRDGEFIKVSEIKPPYAEDQCKAGAPGCRWKLDERYFRQENVIATGGVKTGGEFETVPDRYTTCERGAPWEVNDTEGYCTANARNYASVPSKHPNQGNDPKKALRVTSNTVSDVGGIMSDRYLSGDRARTKNRNIKPERYIYNFGDNFSTLCTISEVSRLATGGTLVQPSTTGDYNYVSGGFIIPNYEVEAITEVNHDTIPNSEYHEEGKDASGYVYASNWGVERNETLDKTGTFLPAPYMIARDLLDSWRVLQAARPPEQRSYSVVLELQDLMAGIKDWGIGNVLKSYGHRVPEEAWDDIGFPSIIWIYYCIGEWVEGGQSHFENVFPAYKDFFNPDGYPGAARGCYPWKDLPSRYLSGTTKGNIKFAFGECEASFPGKPNRWPPSSRIGELTRPNGTPYDPAVYPGPEQEVRTCKVNDCAVLVEELKCIERCIIGEHFPCAFNGECRDTNFDGRIEARLGKEIRECDIQGNPKSIDESKSLQDFASGKPGVNLPPAPGGTPIIMGASAGPDGEVLAAATVSPLGQEYRDSLYENNETVVECLTWLTDTWSVREVAVGNVKDVSPQVAWTWLETEGNPKGLDLADYFNVSPDGTRAPPDRGETYSKRIAACDLSMAGPMVDPGDVWKDHMSRVTQASKESQGVPSMDTIAIAGDMLENQFAVRTNVRRPTTSIKAEQLSSVRTLDLDEVRQTETRAIAELTTNQLSRGMGVGNASRIASMVSRKYVPTVFSEKYKEMPDNASCPGNNYEIKSWCPQCDDRDPGISDFDNDGVIDRGEYGATNWCALVLPPVEETIDLDELETGGCEPNLDAPSCPLLSEKEFEQLVENANNNTYDKSMVDLAEAERRYVGDLAGKIVGAAGYYAGGLPGSVLLGLISGEGWINSPSRMLFDDDRIRDYSENWFDRIYTITEEGAWYPTCNDMNHLGEGPYTEFDTWFFQAVQAGGYHPQRMSPTPGYGPIVSKCNFLDVSYAVAWGLMRNNEGGMLAGRSNMCGGITRAQAEQLVASFQGRSLSETGYAGSSQMGSWVDIIVGCQ